MIGARSGSTETISPAVMPRFKHRRAGMATYTYTGRLTDFGEAPFPDAAPRLWVSTQESAFGTSGPLADKPIPVTVAPDGSFSVNLVASVDTVPPARYLLRVEWISDSGHLAGWSDWEFNAALGGGVIKPDGQAPLSVWFVGPPWPANTPPGFYLERYTGDVGRKE